MSSPTKSRAKVLIFGHGAGMKLTVKRRSPKAILPKRATVGSAGYDLCSAVDAELAPGARMIVATELSIQVPDGTYGRIAPRSGLAVNHGIDTMAGVIDPDFRGGVGVVLVNLSDQTFKINEGDRIGQLILEKIETPEVEEVEELDHTVRGEKGWGSTGGHSLSPPAPAEGGAESAMADSVD